MIKLDKLDPPQVLVENHDEWTEEYMRLLAGDPNVPKVAATRYRHSEIKDQLEVETAAKCAYCESKFAHVYPGAVEHIAPKSKFPGLIVEWSNLTLACMECNGSKGDYYSDARPLLHPYDDQTDDHLAAYGPLIQGKPRSIMGAVTVSRLELNRSELLMQRAEKLNEMNRLRQLAVRAEDESARDFFLEELDKLAEPDKEYSFVARAYAQTARDEISDQE